VNDQTNLGVYKCTERIPKMVPDETDLNLFRNFFSQKMKSQHGLKL